MAIKRAIIYTAAIAFGLLMSAYLFAHTALQSIMAGSKLSAAECTDTDSAAVSNPNKMLFISCGGFLD